MEYNAKKTIEYYDEIAGSYDEVAYSLDGKYYPANHYRLEISKSILKKLPRGRLLDAGCGTGLFLATALAQGFDCCGCDFSEGMLVRARQNVDAAGGNNVRLVQTTLEDLSAFADAEFDCVFSLGVFPYIPEELEGACYREIRRVMRKGGTFVSAHENELFDLFTFNKYTLRFFERNFYPLLKESGTDFDNTAYNEKLAGLIVNHDKPVNLDKKKSARDIVMTRPENPITYGNKLSLFGFSNRHYEYYNFHAMPPFLREGNGELIEASKRMEVGYSTRWQAMFMCSTFVSIATAV